MKIAEHLLESTVTMDQGENDKELQMEMQQIAVEERAIADLESKLVNVKKDSMEKMLLEVQLDTKKDTLKTGEELCVQF